MLSNPLLKNNPPIIKNPVDHLELLHSGGKGKVTFAVRRQRWNEDSYYLEELPELLKHLDLSRDTYISQSNFYGRRRAVNLCQLNGLFVDIDFYKINEKAKPEEILEASRILLADAGLPQPTLGISSGRGIYLLWVHESLNNRALPRWNVCQRILVDCLEPLGADQRAKDSTRVLRLIGSKHANGNVVKAISEVGTVYDFETLFSEIVPHTRAEIKSLQLERAKKREQYISPKGLITVQTIWESRLRALQFWRSSIRFWDELPSGNRDEWLFWASNAIGYLVDPASFQKEIVTLASQYGGWSERETKSRLSTLIRRLKQAEPIYKAREETIIERVGITEPEQRQLYDHFGKPVLCNKDIQREYNNKVQEGIRRKKGVVPREDYLSKAEEKKEKVKELKKCGLSVRKIAKQLNISVGSVSGYLNN